jgi:hypothetical protein
MHPFMRRLAALVILVGSASSMAATDCTVGNEMATAAAAAADRNRQLLEQIDSRQKNIATNTGTCLDKYLNTCLTCQFGFGGFDLGALMGAIIGGAANAACRAVDSTIREATGPFNQSIVLPGGVGRINTNVFGSGMSGGQVSVQTGSIPGIMGPVTVGQAAVKPAAPTPPAPTSFVSQVSSYVSNLFK